MLYLIQSNFYSNRNEQNLIEAIKKKDLEYYYVTPYVDFTENNLYISLNGRNDIFVFGGTMLSKLACKSGWKIGSFLNDNFDFRAWENYLNDHLLNNNGLIINSSKLTNLNIKQEMFVRPITDTKEFTGGVFSLSEICKLADKNIEILISKPIKNIEKEYRCFIIDKKVISATLYKMDNKLFTLNNDKNIELLKFAESIINIWIPNNSCVMDIAYVNDCYKIVEFNNLNGSGFYDCKIENILTELEILYLDK
ncbi:ATP-grasp domain-containing protein [Clostridium beijerinckii]|jgi:hypothetical protein|nr:ATP-grasp domain-containing protein [Clostridium beijerinckii]MBF7810587.1 ATP-grasp domain-containing protein [Clostridium beijerinckii]NOW91305.1 hypothetical protein [Clostridium beijerinckii]NRT23863.1 hypothetical protein [Clostridium beijerinckii]NRT86143.1 hypothetical protein [Clostridium beijerinckii]NRZ33858.1 hypothetical protein [Clostridium beijerinckii]